MAEIIKEATTNGLLDIRRIGKVRLISTNGKTGHSFNLPVLTCSHTTPTCEESCYACFGRFRYIKVIRAGIRRLLIIKHQPLDYLVRRITAEIPWGIKAFRWNGTGDFIPKTLVLLNKVAEIRDDVKFYTYTRDPYLGSFVDKKITLNFSIDKHSIWKLGELKHPSVLVNYLKTVDDEIVPEYVSLIHPCNNKASLFGDNIDRAKTCAYAKTKGRVKCNECNVCIDPADRLKVNLLK